MYGKKKKVMFDVGPVLPYSRPAPVDLDEKELRKYGLSSGTEPLNAERTTRTSRTAPFVGKTDMETFLHDYNAIKAESSLNDDAAIRVIQKMYNRAAINVMTEIAKQHLNNLRVGLSTPELSIELSDYPDYNDILVKVLYRWVRKLGEGTHGSVYLGVDNFNGERVAIKEQKIVRDTGTWKVELEMAGVLDGKRHPNVVKTLSTFRGVSHIYIVMEHVEGGDLSTGNCLVNITESSAINILRQICRGVAFLNNNGIIHSDLKPANVLCSSHGSTKSVKIADFGLAVLVSPRNKCVETTGFGEYYVFAAPEMDTDGSTTICYNYDTWGIGCIAYNMLYGDDYPLATRNSVLRFDSDTLFSVNDLGLWINFIKTALTTSIEQRPTPQELLTTELLIEDEDEESEEEMAVIPLF